MELLTADTVLGKVGQKPSGGEAPGNPHFAIMEKDTPIVIADEATARLTENEHLLMRAVPERHEERPLLLHLHEHGTRYDQILMSTAGASFSVVHNELMRGEAGIYRRFIECAGKLLYHTLLNHSYNSIVTYIRHSGNCRTVSQAAVCRVHRSVWHLHGEPFTFGFNPVHYHVTP